MDMEEVIKKYREQVITFKEYRDKVFKYAIDFLKMEKHFQILKHLGEGTYGDVVSAIIPDSNLKVAVKIIAQDDTVPGELSAWPTFFHPNVLRLLEVMQVDYVDFFITPLMKTDLFRIMKDDIVRKNPHGLNYVKKWLREILEGIHYLHDDQMICHLDIKADNVLIDFDMTAQLSDFSFIEGAGDLVNSYGLCWMLRPPETCPSLGEDVPVDGIKFDIWSFGVLAVNVLTQNFILRTAKEDYKNWYKEIFPFYREILDDSSASTNGPYFLFLMKKALPSSKITLETVKATKSFLKFVLRLRPEERPTLEEIAEDPFLDITVEDHIQRVKVTYRDSSVLSSDDVSKLPQHHSPQPGISNPSVSSPKKTCSGQNILHRFKRGKNFTLSGRERKRTKWRRSSPDANESVSEEIYDSECNLFREKFLRHLNDWTDYEVEEIASAGDIAEESQEHWISGENLYSESDIEAIDRELELISLSVSPNMERTSEVNNNNLPRQPHVSTDDISALNDIVKITSDKVKEKETVSVGDIAEERHGKDHVISGENLLSESDIETIDRELRHIYLSVNRKEHTSETNNKLPKLQYVTTDDNLALNEIINITNDKVSRAVQTYDDLEHSEDEKGYFYDAEPVAEIIASSCFSNHLRNRLTRLTEGVAKMNVK